MPLLGIPWRNPGPAESRGGQVVRGRGGGTSGKTSPPGGGPRRDFVVKAVQRIADGRGEPVGKTVVYRAGDVGMGKPWSVAKVPFHNVPWRNPRPGGSLGPKTVRLCGRETAHEAVSGGKKPLGGWRNGISVTVHGAGWRKGEPAVEAVVERPGRPALLGGIGRTLMTERKRGGRGDRG